MARSRVAVHADDTASSTITDEEEIDALLGALDDGDCRAILPRSTAYRKINTLTSSGLLDERVRLCGSEKHTSEYRLAVEGIHLSVDAGGVELQISQECDREHSSPVPAGAD